MATSEVKTNNPGVDPATGEYRVIALGRDLQVGHRKDHAHCAHSAHAAGLVCTLRHRGRRRDHAAGGGDVAVSEGRRHLGDYAAGGLGLRDHQLCLVDRHRPRRHTDLGHSAALQAELAQLDQPFRRGHDDLCRGLRRHVPADSRGPSVAWVLAVPAIRAR